MRALFLAALLTLGLGGAAWAQAPYGPGPAPAIGSGSAQPYIVAGFFSGLPPASQVVLLHRFAAPVTYPANFGTAVNGASSTGGALANSTASATFTVWKDLSASDPTVVGNWTQIGTVTYSAGGHAPTFATTGSATETFAAGDYMKVVSPSSQDATLASLGFTFAGVR